MSMYKNNYIAMWTLTVYSSLMTWTLLASITQRHLMFFNVYFGVAIKKNVYFGEELFIEFGKYSPAN